MDEDCHCDRKDCECRASAAHIGQWQDGIFSCFRHGLWHPHLWNAWLCPQILLGQLLVRTKTTRLVQNPFQKEELDDNSVNGADNDKHNSTTAVSIQSAFRKIMILVVLLSLYDALVAPPLFDLQVDKDTGDIVFVRGTGFPVWHQILYVLLSLPMTIWGIMVVVRLRAAIRHKHNIPAGRLGRCEDFVCVCCCNCCVMSQMARQTADYDGDEPASCCSPNGIRTLNKKGHDDDDDDEGSSDDDASLNESILRSPVPLESLSSFSSSLSTMSSSSSHSATSVTRRNESRLHNNSLTMATIV
jgi:Cys-rich protein (TIGR01571 family)